MKDEVTREMEGYDGGEVEGIEKKVGGWFTWWLIMAAWRFPSWLVKVVSSQSLMTLDVLPSQSWTCFGIFSMMLTVYNIIADYITIASPPQSLTSLHSTTFHPLRQRIYLTIVTHVDTKPKKRTKILHKKAIKHLNDKHSESVLSFNSRH